MATATLIEIIEVGDTLGEGVLWHAADSSLWWTDIQGKRLHRMAWPAMTLETFETPERVGSFAFVAGAPDVLVAAFETGFALFAPRSGDMVWLSRLFEPGSGERMNDGRVDPAGRFWAGSMIEDEAKSDHRAGLYRLDSNGVASLQRGGLTISNGICWSPDGALMHHSDSQARTIYQAGYDVSRGAMGEVTPFASTEAGAYPDGAVVDASGVLWQALWGAGVVARFEPSGQRLEDILVPASQPSCPAFGGPELDLLFVTTARDGLDAQARAADPGAGHLFVFEAGARGLPGVEAVIDLELIEQLNPEP